MSQQDHYSVEKHVGTVFVSDKDLVSTAEKLAEMCEKLIDHHTYLTDTRHHHEADQKPRKLTVLVRLE